MSGPNKTPTICTCNCERISCMSVLASFGAGLSFFFLLFLTLSKWLCMIPAAELLLTEWVLCWVLSTSLSPILHSIRSFMWMLIFLFFPLSLCTTFNVSIWVWVWMWVCVMCVFSFYSKLIRFSHFYLVHVVYTLYYFWLEHQDNWPFCLVHHPHTHIRTNTQKNFVQWQWLFRFKNYGRSLLERGKCYIVNLLSLSLLFVVTFVSFHLSRHLRGRSERRKKRIFLFQNSQALSLATSPSCQ